MTIKQFRKNKRMSQRELAAALGTSQVAVSRWESGAVQPSAATLSKLAGVFGCQMDDITPAAQTIENREGKMDIIAKMNERHHSGSVRRLLYALGSDATDIIKDAEALAGQQNGVMEMFGVPPTTEDDAAEIAYWEIVKRCKALYFAPITRDQAVVIANAITACGVLHLADDVEYNDTTFCDAWNDAHPNEEPIRRRPVGIV